MANINKITLPSGSTYNLVGSVHNVIGTQTASTNVWTGSLNLPALYDGLTINYYLPWAGTSTAATLNLTLADGTTKTGAKNCYYGNTTRLTTHYGKGSNIIMTYYSAGSIKIDGTATTDDRWIANANYADGNNTYYLSNYYNYFVAGPNKIFPYTIVMQNADGRWESIVTSSSTGTSKARNTHGFRLGQLAYLNANSTYAENAKVGDNQISYHKSDLIDHRYSFNTANNSTSGTTTKKPVYLVGAINASDGLFYLDATWWTQTLPTTADGKLYIYLGDAFDYYRMSFVIDHPVYWYRNGMIREFAQDAATVNGLMVQTAVPANAVFTDTKVTSSANHYTPATASGQDKTASASGATAAWGIDVVKGVTLNTDGKGHVTGLSVTSGKIPGNPDTDTKVTQTADDSTNSNFECLFSATADNTTRTETSKKSSKLKFNPSTGTLTTTKFVGALQGNADTATVGTRPKGFASQADNFTWGNQTGTAITTWNDSTGGSIGFRRDNPSTGQMSIDIDGTIYIKEGSQNIGEAIKSITRSGTTFTYTTLWGNTGTFTQQDNDTKNTAGSTDTSSKIFLIGATSQAANPQTYSDNEVYATSGVLTTKSVQVGGTACTMEYNSTTQSLDFVFA
jgi:hypothetical protein